MGFPTYFPEACPPSDAQAKEVVAYRMCQSKLISNSDFYSYYQLGKNKDGNILGYGVSLFTNINEAKVLAQMPLHRKEFLAEGKTSTICGVIKETPTVKFSSHITWWLYEKSEPEKYFQVVEEIKDE